MPFHRCTDDGWSQDPLPRSPQDKGGIGLNISGVSKRKIKPNLQTVRAVIDGKPARIKASTRAIRNGLVVKPLKRKYGWTRQQKAAAAAS